MELTIKDVARRLNVPLETVLRWIRQGKIPVQHGRGGFTIRTEMLDRWAEEHQLRVCDPRLADRAPEEMDGLLTAMERGGIFYNITGDNKLLVLRAVVETIPNLDAGDLDTVYEKLVEREQLASTGIGHGIALPHPRSAPQIKLPKPQITTCFLAQPVAYEAIDNQPVRLIMVLLGTSTRQHVHLLSRLSFHLRDRKFRDYLLTSPPKEAILDKIAEIECRSE